MSLMDSESYSIKTRIKTIDFCKIPDKNFPSESYSIKTRIKTVVSHENCKYSGALNLIPLKQGLRRAYRVLIHDYTPSESNSIKTRLISLSLPGFAGLFSCSFSLIAELAAVLR